MGNEIGAKRERGYGQWTKTEKRGKFGGLCFAENYLKKHGFKGRLGRNQQGIANPIKQAIPRRNNEGLGFMKIDSAKKKKSEKMWKIITKYQAQKIEKNKNEKMKIYDYT